MPYYCKKCGAVVTGKFCSCCGTRVKDDLREFKLELSRQKRAFCGRHFEYGRQNATEHSMMARCAWDVLERQITKNLNIYNFPETSAEAYSALPWLEDAAERLYSKFCEACASENVP